MDNNEKKEQLNIGVVSDSAWISKFEKTKEYKIMSLKTDVHFLNANKKNYSKLTHLALALYISSKRTKHEADSIELIKEICPEFFKDEN